MHNFYESSLPVVTVKLHNITCRALIDSGASVNVLSPNIFRRLENFKIKESTLNLTSVTGIDIGTNAVIDTEIVINKESFTTELIVSNQILSSNFDLILGLKFLKRYKFTIDCSNCVVFNNSVAISWSDSIKPEDKNYQSEINVNNITSNSSSKTSFGILNKKFKIQPHSISNVEVKISNAEKLTKGDIVYVEPKVNFEKAKFLVAHAVTEVLDNYTCLVQICNLTNETLTLNKNSKVSLIKEMTVEEVSLDHNSMINAITNENDNFLKNFTLTHLNDKQIKEVSELLIEYKDIFANDMSQLGSCSLIQHRIKLIDDVPVRQKPYRVPYHLKTEMKNQLNELLDAGIIQPSTSSYAAPVLLVKKSDGSYRLVADLRKLNAKTLPDNFPIPNLTEMIDMLSGTKFFSSLDLTSGFHQMKMHPDDAHLTGIATELGNFEYVRMPFGLKNASSSFQRLMSIVLSGLNDLSIGCYIDDVIIASCTFEEHIDKLRIVFDRLKRANLKLKPKKCSLLKNEVTYLGHRVTEGKVMPDPKNIQVIQKALPPKNKTEVRAFIGLTGFYRRFIPNYSKLAVPLTNVTKEKVPFKWTEVEEEAFNKLKSYLISQPCLILPDFDKPFAICTDASKHSLGAVLVQEDETGFQHPISFASRKLNSNEINYSVFEKEALAIVFGVQHFKQYLIGKEFTIFCDQKSLSYVLNLKDHNSRIARWIMTLQSYTYRVVHKPGKLNLMADYLSRVRTNESTKTVHTNQSQVINNVQISTSDSCGTDLNVFALVNLTYNDLIHEQSNDAQCRRIISKLNSTEEFSPTAPKFYLSNGLLLCKNFDSQNPRLVVPKSLIQLVLELCHDNNTVAHPGLSRTLHRVKQNFFWYNMYKNVKNYVATCHSCIERKGFAAPSKAPLQKVPTASRPFQKCSIDAVGPLVTSRNGNKWLLVLTDYFSRYPEAYPVPDIKSSTVAKVLIDFISRHGLMEVFYSDRGANFISEAMQQVYDTLGIKKQHTVSYNPQGNGVVERLNKTLIDSLSHLVSLNQTDWCERVPLALMAFRTAYHRTIKQTPAFIVYGRDLVMPYDLIFSSKFRTYNDNPTYVQELIPKLQQTFSLVKENLEKAADNQVASTVASRSLKNIQVGDLVYLHTPKIKVHTSKKLSKLNHGPYRVTRKFSPVLFEITSLQNLSHKQKTHINRLIRVPEREVFPSFNSNMVDNSVQSETNHENNDSQSKNDENSYPALTKPLNINDLLWCDFASSSFKLPSNANTSSNANGTDNNANSNMVDSEDVQADQNDSFDFFRDTSISPISFLNNSFETSSNSSESSIQSTPIPKYNLRPRNPQGFVIRK